MRSEPSSWAEAFPFFSNQPGIVYLDSAATCQKPKPVLDVISSYYKESCATVHRAIYPLALCATESFYQTRQEVASFLNLDPTEVVFTKGTTASLNFLARAFTDTFLKPADRILVPEIEHHANLIPWQMAACRSSASLEAIKTTSDGRIDLKEFANQLDNRVKVVSLAHVSHLFGTIHPIKEIADLAHQAGARVVVDGAQAVAHLPLDFQELGADFYAFSGHKLYGPTGVGVLAGRKEALEELPPFEGGGDMIDEVFFDHTTYASAPMRFEAGTPPIAEVLGLGAAIRFLRSLDQTALSEHEESLLIRMQEGLRSIPGLKILGPKESRAPLLSFLIDGVHPLDLATLLGEKGICVRSGHLCAQPAMRLHGISHVVRASLGLYNSQHDVDKLLAEVSELLALLC